MSDVTAPSGPRLWWQRLSVVAFVVAAVMLSWFHISNLDIGGHVTVGREILKTFKIPQVDFFSHTVQGSSYPVHQWLGAVVLFVVDHFSDVYGLILLRVMMILGCASLLFYNARRSGAPVVTASAIVLLLLVAARPRFFVRPFLVTVIFLPLLQTIIADVRAGHSNRLWRILPLMAIWGHLHSGVVFGVLFLGGTIVGEAAKLLMPSHRQSSSGGWPGEALPRWEFWRLVRYSAIAIALPFATVALINPSGVKPLLLPFLFFRNQDFRAMITEYRSVDLSIDWPFNLVAIAVALGILFRFRRVDLTDLLIVSGFGFLAFEAVRGILPFAVVAAPTLGRTWGSITQGWFQRLDRGRRGGVRVATAEFAVMLLTVTGSVFVSTKAAGDWMFPFGMGKDPRHYPERALDFIYAQSIRGPVFNTDIWASSMLWRWHGRFLPVFVDARLEAYPESFWRDKYYRVLQAAPGWKDVLNEYGVQSAILRRKPGESDNAIGTALWNDPEWGLVYWDDHVVIYLRRNDSIPRNASVLADWEFQEFDPRRPDAVRDLRDDRLVRAANQLAELAEWNRDSFLLWWTLGAAWTGLGNGAEAVQVFEDLQDRPEVDYNFVAFQTSWAEAELVSGSLDSWRRRIESISGRPANTSELFRAASLCARARQEETARVIYQEILSKEPDNGDAMNNLAVLLARTEDGIPRALDLLERAIRSNPRDPYYLASRGEVHWRAGNMEQAEQDLQRAFAMLPQDDAAAREEVSRWLDRIE